MNSALKCNLTGNVTRATRDNQMEKLTLMWSCPKTSEIMKVNLCLQCYQSSQNEAKRENPNWKNPALDGRMYVFTTVYSAKCSRCGE